MNVVDRMTMLTVSRITWKTILSFTCGVQTDLIGRNDCL